jgi:uncharacterized protein YeaO (DUF488 family)
VASEGISISAGSPSRSVRTTDGERVLVNRLRGLSKEGVRIGCWRKALETSDGLRKWLCRDPDCWEGFLKRYRSELEGAGKMDQLREIGEQANKENVTLFFAARATEHDNARALAALVRELVRDARGASLRRAASRLGETPERRTTDRNPRPGLTSSPILIHARY